MNAINSTAASTSIADSSTVNGVRKAAVAFEKNALEYGPEAAAAIGVAGAVGAAAGSTVALSSEGFKRFSAAVGDAVDAVEDEVSGLGHDLMDVGRSVASEVKRAYSAVGGAVDSVASETQHLYSEAADKVSSAASSIEDGASYVTRQIGDVAHYVVAGVSSLV